MIEVEAFSPFGPPEGGLRRPSDHGMRISRMKWNLNVFSCEKPRFF